MNDGQTEALKSLDKLSSCLKSISSMRKYRSTLFPIPAIPAYISNKRVYYKCLLLNTPSALALLFHAAIGEDGKNGSMAFCPFGSSKAAMKRGGQQ